MSPLRQHLQSALDGAFAIERELGGGGMSTVFVAMDEALRRRVVVKVLPPDLAASVSVERFKREIMLVAALQHPHIVPVLAAGELPASEGSPVALPYFIMPYVEGESLRVRLGHGPMDLREAVTIAKDVARALSYAHARGVIHRDIKPDNVLLSAGSATVTDFGVAKALTAARERQAHDSQATITHAGMSLGTPAYMAPEQAAADPGTDHRADLYSLGMMLYEMLAGEHPFAGRSPQALLAAQLTEKPAPLRRKRKEVPAALEALVMRCLEKDPAARPQTADELARSLEDPGVVSGAFGATARPVHRSRALWLAAGAGIALSIAAGGAFFGSRPGVAASGVEAAASAKSIAVLPLVAIGRDTADAYFADGMTNELNTALSRVSHLRVASRTAAQAARGRFATIEELGGALRVQMLLEGTVQRDGGRMRVTARLVNAADGFTIWSDVFDREVKDIFAVQDEIASAIVTAIAPELGADTATTAVAATPGTASLEAYDLYLRGRHFFEQRGERSLRRALVLFQDAAKRDSTFARAWVGIADVYGVLPLYSDMPRDSATPLALSAVNRAISLDARMAEAYASRGNVLAGAWRWAEAEADFRRATQLKSDYAPAHQWYGELLLLNGRLTEARAELRRAAELEPLSAVVLGSYAEALGAAGDTTQAIAGARRAVDLDPDLIVARFFYGSVLLAAGRADSAVAELLEATALDPSLVVVRGLLGHAYAAAGRTAEARQIADRLEADAGRRNGAGVYAARVRIALGDTARGLTLLERAANARDGAFSSEVLAGRAYDAVRASPRFAAVAQRIGLAKTVLAPVRR